MTIKPLNVLVLPGPFQQDANHFISRGIAPGPQHAVPAVSPFLGKDEFPADLIELCAPSDKFLNPRRPFLHQDPRRVFPAKLMSGPDRIGEMQVHVVFGVQGHGDSALGIDRIAFEATALCHDQHPSVPTQLDRGPQPGDSAPDHQEVSFRAPTIRFGAVFHGKRDGLALRPAGTIGSIKNGEWSAVSWPHQAEQATGLNGRTFRTASHLPRPPARYPLCRSIPTPRGPGPSPAFLRESVAMSPPIAR